MAKIDPVAKSLVASAMEFYRRRPWTRVPGDAPFLMRVPGEEQALCVTILGQAGQEFGLLILRGEDGLARMRAGILEDRSMELMCASSDVLMVGFEPWGKLPDDLRGALLRAGFSVRREAAAPMIMHAPPGVSGRWPGRGMMRTIDWCLRGVLAADERGELPLRPMVDSRRRVVSIEVSGKLRRPEISASTAPLPEAASPSVPALALDPDLRWLPRTDERWLATLQAIPGKLLGEPGPMQVLLLVDEYSESVITGDVVVGNEVDALMPALEEALRGGADGSQGGLPREVGCVGADLHAALAPALEGLGVSCTLETSSPLLESIVDSMMAHMASQSAPAARGSRGSRARTPTELADWQEAHLEACALLVESVQEKDAITPRAFKRYFTSEELGNRVLEELSELGPGVALLEWVASDYRATRRSKTLLEKLLERRLEPQQRLLLEAHRDAELSIYRVDTTQPGVSLEVEDVLSGVRHTITDKSLSGCELEGWFIPLRLIHVSGWTFPLFAGPPLGLRRIDEVLDWLEDEGVDPETGGLRARAELLGQLWVEELSARDRPVRMVNFDKEPIERLRVVFHVEDPAALLPALASCTDVEFDPKTNQGEWTRPESEPGPFENGVILARLELLGDKLMIEVNSLARLNRVRAWVDPLPGVRFEGLHFLDDEEVPMDDLLREPPGPLDPESRAFLEQFAHDQAFRWLDLSLPILDGRTPRQAASTRKGRRDVVRLIRTMPPVLSPDGPIQVPREELLRELGLE